MTGKDLLEELIAATELPPEALRKELLSLLKKNGLSEEVCGIEDLREMLADYAQDVLLEAKEDLSSSRQVLKAMSGK